MKLLRVYPVAWRTRYGDELGALIEELDGTARMSTRVRLDVVRAGVSERLRAFGLRGLPPQDLAREGALRVLYAWMLFAVGGFGVEKASEHWQAATPSAKQALPAGAFGVLFVAAGVGSMLVLLGVAIVLPRLLVSLRRDGWREVRRPVLRALVPSVAAVAATVGLAGWAQSLTPAQRNGHDALYGAAFGFWVLLFTLCLFAWASAAAAIARRLPLPLRLLRVESWIATAVSAAMLVMTAATLVWWATLARAAPWFFEGRPAGSSASPLVLNMIVPSALMLCATLLGLLGATRALSARAA